MTLTEMRAALKLDLADSAWDTDELDRGVTKAVADLSRFLPDEAIHECTFVLDVTSEEWTSAAAHGTYVSLANEPIKWDSENIKSADGVTAYTKDTDYTFDYANGKITTIDGGSMAIDTSYLATYTKYREGIDIGSIDANLIRVRRVEYPLSSEAVMKFIPFFIWGDILYIASEQMADKKHIAIYYDKECTAPTVSVDGSFDSVLDEVILKGAAAYALMSRGLKAEHDAKTAVGAADTAILTIAKTDAETALGLVGARIVAATTALGKVTTEAIVVGTALGGIAANLTLADTALDNVSIEIAKAGSDTGEDMENISSLLTDAATALGSVATKITAMDTALAEIAAMWTDEATFRTAASAYLESGDDKIDIVNVGSRVADLYGTYAQIQATLARLSENVRAAKLTESSTQLSAASQYISEANSRANLVNGYISEARERVNQARAYVEEASGWVAIADRKVAEANVRLGLISNYINEANTNMSQAGGYISEASGRLACQELIARQADTYNAIATQQMAMAEKYLAEAIERRNEFWSILKDKQQMRREYSLVAQRQSA